jgi:hypothetical protein
MSDFDFRDIVTKPDNVPIVGLIVLVGFFTWLGLRRAVINDARMAQGLPNLEELGPEKTLTWPDLVYTELIAMVAQTIFLVLWAIALQAAPGAAGQLHDRPQPVEGPLVLPRPAGDARLLRPLDGRRRPAYTDHRRADGHALHRHQQAGQRLLHHQPAQVRLRHVPVRLPGALGHLILLGTFLRGPNWNFFGPYEYWDVHKLIPLNNVNLSDLFWVRLLGTSKPPAILVRELPGILACLAYFVVPHDRAGPHGPAEIRRAGGVVRYLVLVNLLLFMASLPIKMVLRWTINLKYLVAIPEFFFNI